jgi:DNA invertase Pin-like site-specific DNA recombinase
MEGAGCRTIAATFADAAMSGSDTNRPQYRAMLEAAARREFDVLIVDDLSRFTSGVSFGQSNGSGCSSIGR